MVCSNCETLLASYFKTLKIANETYTNYSSYFTLSILASYVK